MAAVPVQGVLTDDDILREVAEGRLIVDNFNRKSVEQACYELRVGDIYYDLSGGRKRYQLTPNEFVLVKPYQLIVIITLESLQLSGDILGRILMKGKLFSLGLQPVNTYADPGFTGRLGIVLHNASPNYIRLDQGDHIAKIEFERLHRTVSVPYRGQHGFHSGIWPVPEHAILSESEARQDSRVQSMAVEMSRSFGEDFGSIVNRVFRYEKVLILSTIGYIGLAIVIIIYGQAADARLSTTFAFVLGLVTNLASGLLIYLATTLRKKTKVQR